MWPPAKIIAISTAPMASGAITPGAAASPVQPIVNTRKNVPMNSTAYWRMARPFGLIVGPLPRPTSTNEASYRGAADDFRRRAPDFRPRGPEPRPPRGPVGRSPQASSPRTLIGARAHRRNKGRVDGTLLLGSSRPSRDLGNRWLPPPRIQRGQRVCQGICRPSEPLALGGAAPRSSGQAAACAAPEGCPAQIGRLRAVWTIPAGHPGDGPLPVA